MDFLNNIPEEAWSWIKGLGIPLLAYMLAWLILRIIRWILIAWMRKLNRYDYLAKALIHHLRRPMHLFLPLLLISFSLPLAGWSKEHIDTIRTGLEVIFYFGVGWVLFKAVDVISDVIQHQNDIDREDNLSARKMITQLSFIRKLAKIIIGLLVTSLILFQFDSVRELGTGLLTSAGVAGIIIGIAAQTSIANLLAGLQIAFTQPMRIDDVVIVEGEWGKIEEITLTYVVVRIWDQRRLVLPIKYFIEQPFQNWSRTTTELLGTVFLYLDYRTPIDTLREVLEKTVKDNPLWDGRVAVVQVTDTSERSMTIRILVSASNASNAFDLRRQVREQLLEEIQRSHPEYLPRLRVERSAQEIAS